MEIQYPLLLLLGIPIAIIIAFINFKKKKSMYNNGKKVANTKYYKNLSYYKNLVNRYRIKTIIIISTCVISVISSLVLTSRISKESTEDIEMKNRDIMICMDVSRINDGTRVSTYTES